MVFKLSTVASAAYQTSMLRLENWIWNTWGPPPASCPFPMSKSLFKRNSEDAWTTLTDVVLVSLLLTLNMYYV